MAPKNLLGNFFHKVEEFTKGVAILDLNLTKIGNLIIT